MNIKIIHHTTIEEIILDSQLVDYLKTISPEELDLLIIQNPEKKIILEESYLLLNHLQLQEQKRDIEIINDGLLALKKDILRRKRRTLLYRVASVAATLLILIVSYKMYTTRFEYQDADTRQVLADLQMDNLDTEKIHLSSKERVVYYNDNDTVRVNDTKDGTINDKEQKESEENLQKLYVPNGKRVYVEFSDGTFAWINSGSKLIYPEKFVGNRREIYLEGEIFLDVARDEKKPFIIHADRMDVKVLGTSLNVSAYKSDHEQSVVLVSGSVEVKSAKYKERLSPDQGFFLSADDSYNVSDVDVYNYTCWKDGIMLLKGKSLEEIVSSLSRYYNVEIEISERYKYDEYEGKLELHESIDDILTRLSLSSKFSFSRDNNKIIIQ